MRWIGVILLGASLTSQAQTTGVPPIRIAGQISKGTEAGQVAVPDTRTEKQKTLAKQTGRLFDMATELKMEVDKTNKNILSLKVVEKAEEIELLAKGMKEQARK